MTISNRKNLSPINLRKFKKKKPLNYVKQINSFCNNNEFQIMKKKDNLSEEEILNSLEKIIFPLNVVKNIELTLYNSILPNIIVLLIFSIFINKNIDDNTKEKLCKIKGNTNNKQSNLIGKLIKIIPYSDFFAFLTSLLCAIKYHIHNLINNKDNKKVSEIFDRLNKSNNIKNNLVLTKNSKDIINKGIITSIYFGYIIADVFYEKYILKKFDIKKFRELMDKNKIERNKNGTSIENSFLFFVYVYNLFSYIVKNILFEKIYSNNGKKNVNNENSLEENYTYNQKILANIKIREMILKLTDHYKLFGNLNRQNLNKINLDNFILKPENKNSNKYLLRRNLSNNVIDNNILTVSNNNITVLNTTNKNRNINGFNIKIINQLIDFIGSKFFDGKKLNINFDGMNISKVVNGNITCNIGYLEQNKNDKNKYCIYLLRPNLNKYLKIATLLVKNTFKEVNIKINNFYVFYELIIFVFIAFNLISGRMNYDGNLDKLKNCKYRKNKLVSFDLLNC
jgi:hypothetical protein